jgi:hypothetical protein
MNHSNNNITDITIPNIDIYIENIIEILTIIIIYLIELLNTLTKCIIGVHRNIIEIIDYYCNNNIQNTIYGYSYMNIWLIRVIIITLIIILLYTTSKFRILTN